MGRSVSYPHNAIHVTYNTWGEKPDDWEDDEGEWADHCDFDTEVIEDVQQYAPTLWPSLKPCNEWLGREDHAILENSRCYVGVSEYCGLVAYWIVPKEDDHNAGRTAMNERWCSSIAPKFEKTFGKYRKIASMSNGEGVFKAIAPDECATS